MPNKLILFYLEYNLIPDLYLLSFVYRNKHICLFKGCYFPNQYCIRNYSTREGWLEKLCYVDCRNKNNHNKENESSSQHNRLINIHYHQFGYVRISRCLSLGSRGHNYRGWLSIIEYLIVIRVLEVR